MKKLIDTWAPVFVWMLLIFSFSSLPTTPVSEIHWEDFIFKKSLHVLFYAILTVLSYRALTLSGTSKKNARIYSIIIAVLYGISDEVHQSLTPGRDPQPRDVVFDTIGSVLAIYLLWKFLPKLPSKLKSLAKAFNVV